MAKFIGNGSSLPESTLIGGDDGSELGMDLSEIRQPRDQPPRRGRRHQDPLAGGD